MPPLPLPPRGLPPPPDFYLHEQPAIIVDLNDQFFRGPVSQKDQKGIAPYTSVSILDPCITIERHGGRLHIAARFNIETTILQYHSKKSDGNELFFHDIVLQYLNDSDNALRETFVTWPESDPSRSFAVTRSTNSEVSGDIGLSGSGTPSANVSLGLSRSTELTVEYSVGSWSVSAHRVVNNGTYTPSPAASVKLPQHQWYWAGTHEETRHLTADLKHTVKRHVVIKRIINFSDFLSPTHIASLEKANTNKPEVNYHRERRKSTRIPGHRNSHSKPDTKLSYRPSTRPDHVYDDTIDLIQVTSTLTAAIAFTGCLTYGAEATFNFLFPCRGIIITRADLIT